MTKQTAFIAEFFQRKIFLILAAIWTVIELSLWLLQKYEQLPKLKGYSGLLIHGVFISGGCLVVGIGLMASGHKRLKRSFGKVHDLNHLYRDTLALTNAKMLQMAGADAKEKVNELLARTEEETISKVLVIIADQFSLLINRQVVVTFWRYMEETNSCIEQETSAHGKDATRPFRARERFDVAHNSVFRSCQSFKGKCCHFYSDDINDAHDSKEGYEDERPDYKEHYQAVLSVPIRFTFEELDDKLGYLQVDTKSRYRLNDVEHLYLLSAYADQLYNFLSLVRRNFLFA
jgi:hypothetical protein